jgi:putative selenium metabolism hydrolase
MATADPERVLAFCRDLVRIDSTPNREEAIVRRIVEEMRALGYDDARIDEAGNAVGRLGQGRLVVLIDCHIDTIPLHSHERWTHDPFGAEIEDGRLYGLGSCDMKGSAAAMVHGVAALMPLRERLHGTVFVVCSIAEEHMEGAALAATFDACAPDLAIIGEPTDLRLAIGQRGRAKLEVTVTGQACHAGHPTVGINAVERMAELIGAVARLPHPTHPLLGVRSITCIDIHSEPYPSVSMVPGSCTARFDCRFAPGDTADSLLALLREQGHIWDGLERPPGLDCHVYEAEFDTYNGRHYRVPEFAAAWETDPASPLVRNCLAALQQAGLPAETSAYRFCTNGSLTAGLRGVPTVGFGVGREADAHTVDESISVGDLYRCADGYAALVGRLLGVVDR